MAVRPHGPDGFGSFFYRENWKMVGEDDVATALDVLQGGELLKELNTTVINY